MRTKDASLSTWKLRGGLVLLALFALMSAWQGMRSTGMPPSRSVPNRCAPQGGLLSARVARGMSFVHSSGRSGGRGYGTPTSEASLRELRNLGVQWVSLMPFGFMTSPSATSIRGIGGGKGGESDERLQRESAAAHRLGMKVLLKPHLWIRGGQWCGEIDPGPGWGQWFDSYKGFILHYAQLAADSGMDMLAVGVELCRSTVGPESEMRWRDLIAQIRKVFRGPLVYAANWDEVGRVPFWDALDFIGTQFYPPLAEAPDSPPAAMAARLREQLDSLEALSRRVGHPVIFTEVGYKSVRGAAMSPHEWPEHLAGRNPVVSEEAQAEAYRVFFEGIRDRDFVRGVYPWKWFSDPDSKEEGPEGFGLRGKAAEAVLRQAYGGDCPTR